MLLVGKVALITGAAQGIGKGIATSLAAEGAVVILTDIQDQKVAAAAAEIHGNTGATTRSRRLDVTDGNGIRTAVEAVVKEFDRIDILVNNAGVQDWVPFLETSEEMWDRHQAVNVKGTFLLSQAVARDHGSARRREDHQHRLGFRSSTHSRGRRPLIARPSRQSSA